MGDKLLLKLNIYGNPIANKYCEGKVKRTLKKELKDLKPLRRKLWETVIRALVAKVDALGGRCPLGAKAIAA